MTAHHVVVDGSNLATEGRNLPSLQQLDEAVRSYLEEYKPETVTVIVDASFPNRIDESERPAFEDAIDAGELISPPAGVIGRGDAFVLQIADRADAVVLSNDSFQEFHGQYGWLFDQGRLVGGKPVPHVGWVFMERSPVRGPASRRSVSDAKRAAKRTAPTAAKAKAAKSDKKATPKTDGKAAGKAQARTPSKRARGTTPDTASTKGSGGRRRRSGKDPAPAKQVALAKGSDSSKGGRRGRSSGGGVEPYNDALPFIEFVSAHPVGSSVDGGVERFASHGAYVLADGTRCYLPLKHLADPAPRSAREVLSMGETYTFVVHAFDTPRRGVDLTMPGVVPGVAGTPASDGAASDPVQPTEEERVAAARKKAPAKKKAAAKKAPARKKAPAKRKTAAKKAPARKKATAKTATARKQAPATRKSPATRAPAP
jgi:hypothetical protein